MIKAQAVRSKFCAELKAKRRLVIHAPDNWITCQDVAETFADGGLLDTSFMNFYVKCLRAEEMAFRPKCVGYRVFLSGYLGEMLNHVEERQQAKHPDLAALIKLEAEIGDLDIFRVKLVSGVFVPVALC